MRRARHLPALWLWLLPALVLVSGEITAQGAQRSALAHELISMAVNPSSDYMKSGRAKFVRLLAAYCQEILNVIPTNTPSEDAWVAAEGQTTDLAKIARFESSPEFSRHHLKDVFLRCNERADQIIQAQGTAPRTESVVRNEAAAFVSLAANFNNDNDIEIYAMRAGLSPQVLGLDFLQAVRFALLVHALRTLENR